MSDGLGPPEEVEVPALGRNRHPSKSTAADNYQSSAPIRQCGASPLRRRRYAADRCTPLHSGHRDPWQPVRPEMSPAQVQAAVDAAHHLLARDLPPIFDRDALSAMWTAGHRDVGALTDEALCPDAGDHSPLTKAQVSEIHANLGDLIRVRDALNDVIDQLGGGR